MENLLSLRDKTPANWYERHPESVVEEADVTIVLDFSINTENNISKLPDIIIKDRKEKSLNTEIKMSKSNNEKTSANVFLKKTMQIRKPEDEKKRCGHLKTKTVPIGARSLISKKKNLTANHQNSWCTFSPGNLENRSNKHSHILQRTLSVYLFVNRRLFFN